MAVQDLDAATILLRQFSPRQLEAWARKELQTAGLPTLEEYIELYLNETIWSKQKEICQSVEANRYTAVKSCHGTGKSFISSRIITGWVGRYAPGEAFAITTAPTDAQVKAILWREINKCFKRNTRILPGRVNLKEWYIDNELVAFGRKPADTDEAAFQGIHQRYLLIVFDEASGIPKELWDAARSLMTNEDCRFLAIGNPDVPDSHFQDICKPGSGWNVIHIPAWVTPAYTGESLPKKVLDQLVTKLWVEERRADWLEDSPLWIAKVEAEFPADSEDGVIPASRLLKCKVEKNLSRDDLVPVTLGVDVGAGGDATVIRERRGRKAGRVWRNHSRDSETVTKLIVKAVVETGATKVRIDSAGIGWGVVGHVRDKLRQMGGAYEQVRVLKVNVAQASSKPTRFPKLRDQLWWEVGRELSVQGFWDLSGVDDQTLNQLLSVKYEIDSVGRVKIEPKDETKKRIKRSPDDADAMLLAFYDGRGAGADFREAWDLMLRQSGRAEEADRIADLDLQQVTKKSA